MKSRLIKLMLSVLSTTLAAVSLTASTFAYVLINNKVVVPDFDFNIQGQEGLEISLDNKNWSKDILANSIKEKIYNENKDNYLANHINSFDDIRFNCTSISQELDTESNTYKIIKDDNNQIQFYYDVVEGRRDSNNNITYEHIDTPANANADKGYIKFDLYFRSKSTYENKSNYKLKMTNDTNISSKAPDSITRTINNDNLNEIRIGNKLTTRKFILEDVENSNLKKVTLDEGYQEYNPGDTVYVDISNAIRLGVYNVVENNNQFVYDTFNIYELSNEYDLGSAALKYDDYENKDIYNPEYNAMYTYYNNYFVKYPFISGSNPGDAFNTRNKEELLNDEFGTFEFIENENRYNVIKLEIYIWLEGWDADYFVGIPDSTTIRVDLGFEIEKINQ